MEIFKKIKFRAKHETTSGKTKKIHLTTGVYRHAKKLTYLGIFVIIILIIMITTTVIFLYRFVYKSIGDINSISSNIEVARPILVNFSLLEKVEKRAAEKLAEPEIISKNPFLPLTQTEIKEQVFALPTENAQNEQGISF